MCYSKEVTFTVGVMMVASSAYTWMTYVRGKSNETLVSAYKNIIFGYLLIALHQFGEALSIATGSQIIYKTGLIASISCMFFYMRSLEKLSHFSFGSNIFALLIAICAIQILSTDMFFENLGFWVRGDESSIYLLWSAMWLALFIYWNSCVMYLRSVTTLNVNRKLLIYYAAFSIDISFILYSLYAYYSLYIQRLSNQGLIGAWDIFTSFNVVKDSPSIWCVFSVINAFLIPILFKMMNEKYDPNTKLDVTYVTLMTKLKLLGISALIWMFFWFFFPMIFAVAEKIVLG